jgi:hypothetical protein
VRRSWSAQQRLRLGPGRYRSCSRYAVTNADAESYANTNSYTCCLRAVSNTVADSNSDGHCDSNRDADSNTNSNAYCYCHSNPDGYIDRNSKLYTQGYSDTAGSTDASAAPVAR